MGQEYPETEQKFIENGHDGSSYKFVCDLNATDDECRTALYLGVANGHTEIVQYLTNVSYLLGWKKSFAPCLFFKFKIFEKIL